MQMPRMRQRPHCLWPSHGRRTSRGRFVSGLPICSRARRSEYCVHSARTREWIHARSPQRRQQRGKEALPASTVRATPKAVGIGRRHTVELVADQVGRPASASGTPMATPPPTSAVRAKDHANESARWAPNATRSPISVVRA